MHGNCVRADQAQVLPWRTGLAATGPFMLLPPGQWLVNADGQRGWPTWPVTQEGDRSSSPGDDLLVVSVAQCGELVVRIAANGAHMGA
jgi:hypothetical protein